MIVIVRREPEREEVEPHDKAWFVAEVVSLQSGGAGDAFNGAMDEDMLTIWEMGNPQGVATTGVNHLYAWKGEAWCRRIQAGSSSSSWVPKDMFLKRSQHAPKDSKTNRNWEKVILTIPLNSIVDYGARAAMVQGDHNKVKRAVLNAIDRNPNVLWKRPPSSRKRKRQAQLSDDNDESD